jgi:hypothetical protein
MEAAPMSLAGMFTGSTPHALVSTTNPVFDYELRRMRSPSTPQSLKRFSRYTLLIAIALAVIFFLCVYVAYRFGRGVYPYPSPGVWFHPMQPFLQFVIIASVISADLYYIVIASNSMNVDKEGARWDLLRVTTLPEQSILAAIYAMVQIRGWRIMAVERAFTVAVAVINLLFFASYYLEVEGSDTIGLLPPVISLVAAFFIPMWRMQAITALGIAVSARVRQSSLAAAIMFVGIILLHILLAFNLLDFLAYITLFVILVQLAPVLTFVVVFTVGNIALPMFLCWLMKNQSLRYALRAAFRPE